jgi:hypothetical protein
MRRYGWLGVVLVCLLAAAAVWAVAANSVNVSKENGYAVLEGPTTDALVSKENGYAVLAGPSADALVSKANLYVVITKSRPNVEIIQ